MSAEELFSISAVSRFYAERLSLEAEACPMVWLLCRLGAEAARDLAESNELEWLRVETGVRP